MPDPVAQAAAKPRLPRAITDDVIWFGDCLKVQDGDRTVHGHMSTFLVKGHQTLMVDTGHPSHWEEISSQLDELLGSRELDYVFPTHLEMPHAGNCYRILEKYPSCMIVGDVRDYHLYYPEFTDRLIHRQSGEAISLGDRDFTFLRAPLRDIPNSLWGYDSGSRTMFVADGFAYMHQHFADECALFSNEYADRLDPKQTVFVNERALFWTKFIDVDPVFEEVRELLRLYPSRIVAPAHGGVIPDVEEMLPIIEEGLRLIRQPEEGD